MVSDGRVQLAPDSTGKSVDTTELTRQDGTVVERERVVLGSNTDSSFEGVAAVVHRQISASDVDVVTAINALLAEVHALRSAFESWSGVSAISDSDGNDYQQALG